MRAELWKDFEDREEQMRLLRRNHSPNQHDYNDSYNQINLCWNNRGFTGMDANPRMKEMFVELENWIEDVIGLPR